MTPLKWLDSGWADLSPAAWCCAYFPTTCDAHGFASTQRWAWRKTVAHWLEVHR